MKKTGMDQKKTTQEKLMRNLLNIEEERERKSMANPSVNVIYDDVQRDTLVYLTDVVWHEAHNDKGRGICLTLNESVLEELMLKLQFEPQMTQEEANNESLSASERNKHNDY